MNNRPSLKLKGEQEEAGEEEPLFYSSFYSRIYICIFLFSFATQLTTLFGGQQKHPESLLLLLLLVILNHSVWGKSPFSMVESILRWVDGEKEQRRSFFPEENSPFSILQLYGLVFFSQNLRKKGRQVLEFKSRRIPHVSSTFCMNLYSPCNWKWRLLLRKITQQDNKSQCWFVGLVYLICIRVP